MKHHKNGITVINSNSQSKMFKQKKESDGMLMIRYAIDPNKYDDFGVWKKKAETKLKKFSGFVTIAELNAIKDDDFHYVIIRFDNAGHATLWINSDERKEILNDSHISWMVDKQEIIHDWDIFWYDIFRKSKKWKQWAVTFLAVYPLTIVMPWAVRQINDILPLSFFAGLLRALLISGFMVFLIMPFMMKFFKKWLHK